MANVYAIASGNWSNTAIWNTGALPTAADDVFSNSFTVTIDGTFTVLSIRNTASAPIVVGGTFTFANGGNLTCTAPQAIYLGTTTPVLQMTLGAGNVATFTGTVLTMADIQSSTLISLSGLGTLNLIGDYSVGGTTTNSTGSKILISISANGNLNITGNLNNTANAGGSQSTRTVAGSAGTITIVGNVASNTTGTAGGASCETIVTTSCIVNITGNVSNAGTKSAINTNAGSLTIVGNVTANGQTAAVSSASTTNVTGNVTTNAIGPAISVSSATTLTITGDLTAGSSGNAVTMTNGGGILRLTGNLYNVNNRQAFNGFNIFVNASTPMQARFFTPGIADRTLYSEDTFPNQPAATNVRESITYGPGSGLVGTLAMPAAADVRSGVVYDNGTTGTALFTTSQLLTEISVSPDPVAVRLRQASTPEILGTLLAAYKP